MPRMMRNNTVLCLGPHGFHRMHYTEWGDPARPRVVVCVHGLTRNCRDFDSLAQALASECHVVCPDVAGRGRSGWLAHKEDYGYPQYMADMTTLMARATATPAAGGLIARLRRLLSRSEGTKHVCWVGTSMGGLIGMLLAAQPESPIAKLVLNDVGPLVPKASLERIASYVGKDPRFATFEQLEAYVRQISAPFGPLTDGQWRHLTLHGVKQYEDGSWGMVYDPGIAAPFRSNALQDVDLWQHYDNVRCPTLLLRGAQSDLLPRDIAQEMTRRGPRPRLIEFPGIGHAPMLMSADQIAAVREFLLAGA